jgi:hypothetical protein
LIVGTLLAVIALQERYEELLHVGGALVICGVLLWIPAYVLALIILYRAWSAIQPLRHMAPRDAGMPTPGKAVGFLFIPFFNIYWMFVAYYGLLRRANRLLADRCSQAPPANDGLALAFVILCLIGGLAAVPVLGVVYLISWYVIGYLVHRDMERVARLLPAAA